MLANAPVLGKLAPFPLGESVNDHNAQHDGACQASTLADLKAERAVLGAKGRQIETEAAPIRYVAELIGANADSERAIRWLILMMVLCCDPLAITLTAAASARR